MNTTRTSVGLTTRWTTTILAASLVALATAPTNATRAQHTNRPHVQAAVAKLPGSGFSWHR